MLGIKKKPKQIHYTVHIAIDSLDKTYVADTPVDDGQPTAADEHALIDWIEDTCRDKIREMAQQEYDKRNIKLGSWI